MSDQLAALLLPVLSEHLPTADETHESGYRCSCGDDPGLIHVAAHLQATLESAFELVPKGQLHQEWFIPTHRGTDGQHRGSLFFATEEKATSYRDEWLPNGEIVSRLVGPWMPTDSKEG